MDLGIGLWVGVGAANVLSDFFFAGVANLSKAITLRVSLFPSLMFAMCDGGSWCSIALAAIALAALSVRGFCRVSACTLRSFTKYFPKRVHCARVSSLSGVALCDCHGSPSLCYFEQ